MIKETWKGLSADRAQRTGCVAGLRLQAKAFQREVSGRSRHEKASSRLTVGWGVGDCFVKAGGANRQMTSESPSRECALDGTDSGESLEAFVPPERLLRRC